MDMSKTERIFDEYGQSTDETQKYVETDEGYPIPITFGVVKSELQLNMEAVKLEHISEDDGQYLHKGNEYQPSEDHQFPFFVVNVEHKVNMDVIKTEYDSNEEEQSQGMESKYWQTDVNHEDHLIPIVDDIMKSEFQDVDQDIKIEPGPIADAVGTSPSGDILLKIEEDVSAVEYKAPGLVNIRPFSCDVCNKSFSQLCALKTHRRVHTGERSYLCNVCKKSFSELGKLKRHHRVHTNSCDVCEKSFARVSDLKTHLRMHTGECPYSCDVCKKSFSRHGNLKIHQRMHTYLCDVCKKSFSEPGKLKIHQRVHTGECSYSCNVCKKSFSRRSNMKIHQRTHTYLSDV